MIVSSPVRILRACSKVASITGLRGISLSFCFLFHFVLFVVYHLQGQTGRFMVWLNGSQSSGLVNFVPESRLPFVQTSSIYRKTAAKSWNGNQRWLWKNGTRISVWNILSGKTGLPFQMFRCSFLLEYLSRKNRTTFSDVPLLLCLNFPLTRAKKSCSLYFPTGFPGKFW